MLHLLDEKDLAQLITERQNQYILCSDNVTNDITVETLLTR
ncbi:hypothetical protein KPLM21_1130009 [Klebsiella pneumoniae]|nr:hypothetical protein KPLM21_1130009 [Klebsiella pneumoniae]